ncbi:TPA: hypothetical protein ACKRFV_001151 [Proteus mirabilis]
MDDLIKKILSKETLLLALLTGSSYFFAYLFEFGYSQYFNYPHEFISINLENIIKAIEFKKLNPTSEQIREIMRIVTSDLFSIRNLLSEIKGFNIQFKIIFSIITFACISYIFISIGNIYAQNQRYLSIIEDKDKNYAIVRQYNETIIAKEIKNNLIFNEENHIFI